MEIELVTDNGGEWPSSAKDLAKGQAKLTLRQVVAEFDGALLTTYDEDFRFVFQRVKGVIDQLRKLAK